MGTPVRPECKLEEVDAVLTRDDHSRKIAEDTVKVCPQEEEPQA